MSQPELIYPRSPRETMSGWVYLPRFVDKVRLHLAGKLHSDYQPNFAYKGFDAALLKAAGVAPEAFIEVVKASITDGQVADWVSKNVVGREQEKAAFREYILALGSGPDEAIRARLQTRKADAGLGHRNDLQTFVDFIDADEKRI